MTAKEILTDAGLAESHWGKRIIAAEERGRFSLDECDEAGDWPTCACGQADPNIPRMWDKSPADALMRSFGVQFFDSVNHDSFFMAANYLIAIERRAGELMGVRS